MSKMEEIAKKQEVSDGNCNTNDPSLHSWPAGGAGMNPVQHTVTQQQENWGSGEDRC